MEDRSGQRLDKYHLIRQLGSGSFGEVYLAEQVYRKTLVAVKILPKLANDDIADFLNEARTVVLRHPNIVQVLDFGIDNHIPFIVMEYIPNGTLRQLYPKGTRIPLHDLIPYIKQIADALNYAHDENLIHRDVKPENILLRLNNEVLLSDFGIATIARSSHSRSVLKMAGTLAYMAPEQIEGKPVLASDQYALGIIVYEYLSGERPFNGGPIEIATQHMVTPPPGLRSKVPTLSPDIEQVVLTALAKGPSKRFANVRAFAHALAQASESPKQPEPVVPNLISPAPSFLAAPPLQFLPKKQTINVTPLSIQQSNVFSPDTMLPTSEKPSLASSPRSAFFETPPPIAQSEISPVGRKGSTSATAPQPVMQATRNKRSRLFYPVLALIVLVILGVIGGGAYLYQTMNANAHADTHVQNAQLLITKANGEVANNPATALLDLANAQKLLRSIQQNSSFSDTQRNKALAILQGDLTHGVQHAITNYNKQSAITALCSSNATGTPLNLAPTGPQPSTIAMVQGKSTTYIYALGADSKLYQLVNNSLLPVPLPLASTAKVQGIASNSSQLVLLVAQPFNVSPNLTYSLNLLPTDQSAQGSPNSGQLKFAASVPIDPKLFPNGQTPQLIASTSSDVYVVIGAKETQSSVQIIDYALNSAGKPLAQATYFPFTFSHTIDSIAAFPNHQLFFLLADGSIQSLQYAPNNQAPTSVLLQGAIALPLANSGQPFTWQTPVPIVTTDTTGGTNSLSVPGTTSTSALAVSLVNKVPHLFILDVVLHRILELTTFGASGATSATGSITPTPKSTSTGGGVINAATPITLSLVQQYASSTLFTQGKSVVVDTPGVNVNVLTQSSPSSSSNLVAFSTHPQTSCA